MEKYNIEIVDFKRTEIFENVSYQASLLINNSMMKVSMEYNIIYERNTLFITV